MTILLALVGSAVFGTADFIGGAASRHVPPVWMAMLGQAVALVLAVPLALLVTSHGVTATDAFWSLAGGVVAAVGLGFFYTAMGRGLISVVVPLTSVVGAAVPVTYGLGRGERPGSVAMAGIVIALIAVAIVSAIPGETAGPTLGLAPAPIAFSFAAGACFGTGLVFFSRVGTDAGLWPVVLSRSTTTLVLLCIAVALTGRPTGVAAEPHVAAGGARGRRVRGGRQLGDVPRAGTRSCRDRVGLDLAVSGHDRDARDGDPRRAPLARPARRGRARARLRRPHLDGMSPRRDLGPLEHVARAVAAEWGVELGPPFALSYHSYVATAGEDAVVKVRPVEDDESDEEPDALELWDGDGAVRLLRRDDERRSALIERARPGTDISELPEDEATAVAVVTGLRLWRPAGAPFRWIGDHVPRWLDDAERSAQPGHELVPLARELYASLAVGRSTLVHGDFHHHNILASERGHLAIDPKAMLGEPEYDVPSFLWNPLPYRMRLDITERRLAAFAAAGLDEGRMRCWTVIRASYLGADDETMRLLRALV